MNHELNINELDAVSADELDLVSGGSFWDGVVAACGVLVTAVYIDANKTVQALSMKPA
jgi:hypothetical protein